MVGILELMEINIGVIEDNEWIWRKVFKRKCRVYF